MTASGENELCYAGRPFSSWVKELSAKRPQNRELAAAVLASFARDCRQECKSPPDALVSALLHAITDEDARVRRHTARALLAIPEEYRPAMPQLAVLVEERVDDFSRSQIRAGIGDLGGARKQTLPLFCLLTHGDDEVREEAAIALASAKLADLEIEADLRRCLSDTSAVVRTWICWAVWQHTQRGDDLAPILVAALADERSRLDAARLLCRLKNDARDALPALLRLHDDPNWLVRWQAVRATMQIPCSDEMALPILEALQQDENEILRMYIAKALQHRGRH